MPLSTMEETRPVLEKDFDEIEAGHEFVFTKLLAAADVDAFAETSGDRNPLHMEDDFARATGFKGRVVHGMLLGSYLSTVIGMHLPGPGSLWTQQSFRWRAAAFIGDRITLTLRITQKSPGTRTLAFSVTAMNQDGTTIMDGEGTVKVLERSKPLESGLLSERIALLSDSSGPVAGAIAMALARQGVAVGLLQQHGSDTGSQLCSSLRGEGARAIAVEADATEPGQVGRAVKTIAEEFGRPIDVFISVCGATEAGSPFLETPWAAVHSALDSHLKRAYCCCQAVLPGMLEKGSGSIVTLGFSGSGLPLPSAVAASGLRSLTRALARELGPKNIRVNMVSPGVTASNGGAERLRKLQAAQTPLRRLCTPEDIAQAVVFLFSSASAMLTGVELPVCGGSDL
jgi:3-oxoacyl-[acyl-carrier protein] reductase